MKTALPFALSAIIVVVTFIGTLGLWPGLIVLGVVVAGLLGAWAISKVRSNGTAD